MRRSPLAAVLVASTLMVATMQVASGWLGVVTTHGVSMEPSYNHGDLVFTRRSPGYGVGDVIAYRSEQLADEVVLHRVVGLDGNRYVTQGDNNAWVDRDRPTDADVVGGVWFHLANAGPITAPLRRMGPLVAVGAVLLLWLGFIEPSRLADPTRRTTVMTTSIRGYLLSPSGPAWILGAFAASGLLAVVGFRHPSSTLDAVPLEVRHEGAFAYQAPATRSIVYPDGAINTGDPVFRSATDELTVRYEHQIQGPRGASISGALTGEVELRVGSWGHQLPAPPPVALSGGRGRLETTIDLDELETVLEEYRSISGVAGGDVVLRFQPVVMAELAGGSVAGHSASDASLSLSVLPDEIGIPQDSLRVRATDTVEVRTEVTEHLEVLGRSVPVAHVRMVGLGGMILASSLLAAAGLLRWRSDEGAPIVAAARGRLVRTGTLDALGDALQVLDVAAFKRLAGESDAVVLHALEADGAETFVVDDGRHRYRYTTRAQTTGERA